MKGKKPINCIACNNTKLKTKHSPVGQLFVCSKCNLEWQRKMPTPKELTEIYASYFQNEIEYTKPEFFKAVYKRYVSKIKKGTALDMGCGRGEWLFTLLKKGWVVEGFDFTKTSVEKARSVLKTKSIKVSSVEKFSTTKKYELVSMFDFIEHVYHPAQTLQKAAKLLKPKGHLLLNTPDTSSWLAKLFKKKWFQYKKEHLTYFNKESMTSLLKKEGFKIIQMDSSSKVVSIYLLHHHFKRYHNNLLSPIFRFLYDICGIRLSKKIKFNLPTSELIVLAQKQNKKRH